MTSSPPVLVLIVATSLGEVDWILPVLFKFKEKYPDWQIVTLFGHEQVYQRLAQNKTIFDEFSKLSSLNIVPQEIDLFLTENISPDQVKIILKDYNKDEFSPYKQYLSDKCPDALLVNYPHSNHIYSNNQTDSVQQVEDPDAFSRHDLFLLCSEHDIPHWSASVDRKKTRVVGYPRYDAWWVSRLLQSEEFSVSEEYQFAKQAEHVFFYISRGVHPHYLSQEDYEYLLHSIMVQTLQYENSVLFIKPHPRQDMEELLRMLRPYDPSRWMISGLHLMQLASLSDVVLSGWSSGILDTLAVGKPVIEFWRFGGKDPLCRKKEDGEYTTIYRELGLAAPANTSQELGALLAEALHNPASETWQHQAVNFRACCKKSESASDRALQFLVEGVAEKNGSLEIKESDISALQELKIAEIERLVHEGEKKKARECLDELVRHYPEDANVLNNLGIFLYNEGDVVSAVEQLVKALRCNPQHIETAANLTQIMLELERPGDAVNVVASFYESAVSQEVWDSFQSALTAQLTGEQYLCLQRTADDMSDSRV